MKDKFEELGCDFLNESDCEEQLDDEGLSFDEVADKHFNDGEED
jgi:hypothetical protein